MKTLSSLLLLCASLSATAETQTFDCTYPAYSDPKGLHSLKEPFEMTFLLDGDSGKGYILGNNGSSEVMVIAGEGKLSMLEATAAGNLMTTAIDSALNSVHSRNTVIAGEILPSQFYGRCIRK